MRKRYQPKDKLLTDPVMAHMREVAFSNQTRLDANKVVDKGLRMRDDEALLDLAEQKRLRKAAKRLHHG